MNNYRLYHRVSIAEDCIIGDFSSIGLPTRGYQDGELQTILRNGVEIQSHATICCGNVLDVDTVVGHGTYICHSNQIGKRVSIGAHSILEWNVTIEDDVTIGPYAGIAEHTYIERGTCLGAQVALPSVLHPICPKAKECGKGSHLYRGVTVGAGVTIYPDLRIGEGAYIEPCSVVVRDVSPYTVVAGNPAKEIGDIFSLYPGILEQIGFYVDLSKSTIERVRDRFGREPSLFASR